jgi:hypothetical protein
LTRVIFYHSGSPKFGLVHTHEGSEGIRASSGRDVETQLPCTRRIEQAATDVLRMIQNILEISKLEAGMLATDLEDFPVDAALRESVEDSRPHIDAAQVAVAFGHCGSATARELSRQDIGLSGPHTTMRGHAVAAFHARQLSKLRRATIEPTAGTWGTACTSRHPPSGPTSTLLSAHQPAFLNSA